MKRLIWTAVAASLAALALIVAPSQADFNIGYYTHDSCTNWSDPNTRVDPINYVFFDWGTILRVDNQVIYHSQQHGWVWNDKGGTSQKFITHSTCYDQDDQHSDNGVAAARNHFREKALHYDVGLGYTIIADAHHENLVWCGSFWSHAVDANSSSGGSGYNKGRANLTNNVFSGTAHMSGSPSSYTSYFGNTQLMRQCNGDYASSDGWARFMPIHQNNHY